MNEMRKLIEAVKQLGGESLEEDTAFRSADDMLQYVLRRLRTIHQQGSEAADHWQGDRLDPDFEIMLDEIESLLKQLENSYVIGKR